MKKNQDNSVAPQRPSTRHCLRLCVLPLLLVIAALGCKHATNVAGDLQSSAQQAKAPADAHPAGTYNLVSVDGKPVPCALAHAGGSGTINSGTFVINPDGTCSSKINFSRPSAPDATREVKARYTRDGSKLTMKWQGAGTTIGTVEGSNFTMDNEGMIFAYRK